MELDVDSLVKQLLSELRDNLNKIYGDEGVIRGYFKDEINGFEVIGFRHTKPGPEKIEDRNRDWIFCSYCNYASIKDDNQGLYNFVKAFKQKYNDLNPELSTRILLQVVGAIQDSEVLISEGKVRDWVSVGIHPVLCQLNEGGDIIRFDPLSENKELLELSIQTIIRLLALRLKFLKNARPKSVTKSRFFCIYIGGTEK